MVPPVDGATSAMGRFPLSIPHLSIPHLGLLLALAIVLVGSPAPLDGQIQTSNASYLIEFGEAIIPPGGTEALLPVYITTETELLAWQMGLEYDELIISVESIDFSGTESSELAPFAITTPAVPPLQGITVVYTGGNLLPAGNQLLAAFLRVVLVDPTAIPTGGHVQFPVTPVTNESTGLLLTDELGGTVVPGALGGGVTLFDFPLLALETTSGDAITSAVSMPILLWTDGPSTTLQMGLEYDELIVCDLLLNEGAIDEATGGNYEVESVIGTGASSFIITSLAGPLPAFNGEVIGWLEVQLPSPQVGSFLIGWSPQNSAIDGVLIDNLLGAAVTWDDHFLRGDASLGGIVDLADAMLILSGVFEGVPFNCPDAADANDDGFLDISDPILLLQYLFAGGSPPPAPFPTPGPDTTVDPLSCL